MLKMTHVPATLKLLEDVIFIILTIRQIPSSGRRPAQLDTSIKGFGSVI